MANASLGVLLLGVVGVMVWLALNQRRQLKESGNRLPIWATIVIVVGVVAAAVFGFFAAR